MVEVEGGVYLSQGAEFALGLFRHCDLVMYLIGKYFVMSQFVRCSCTSRIHFIEWNHPVYIHATLPSYVILPPMVISPYCPSWRFIYKDGHVSRLIVVFSSQNERTSHSSLWTFASATRLRVAGLPCKADHFAGPTATFVPIR